MSKGRMEAFSDGVLAIVITIMVLELSAPRGATLDALIPLIPTFLSYVLSFVYVGIYWNNHHHLMHAVKHVNGPVLWANLHLLFWLSLVPFATAWMDENSFAPLPVALYGTLLLMAGIAYFILTKTLLRIDGRDGVLAAALGRDIKGKLSLVIYGVAIGLTLVSPWISVALYVVVAIIWFLPDRRIERTLRRSSTEAGS